MFSRDQVRTIDREQGLTFANEIARGVGIDLANPSREARLHIGLPPLINLHIAVETKLCVDRLGFNLPQHNADALHSLRRELEGGKRRLLYIAGLRIASRSSLGARGVGR